MKERMAILFGVVTANDADPSPSALADSQCIVNSELNRLARESGIEAPKEMPNGEL